MQKSEIFDITSMGCWMGIGSDNNVIDIGNNLI